MSDNTSSIRGSRGTISSPFTTGFDLQQLASKLNVSLRAIVFKDQLPGKLSPGAWIVNMQDSSQGEGTHWVAVFVPKNGNSAAYFDSFGEKPPKEIQRALNTRQWIYNYQQIQDLNTGFCGQYIIFWLEVMSRRPGIPIATKMRQFQNMFEEDTRKNKTILLDRLRLSM